MAQRDNFRIQVRCGFAVADRLREESLSRGWLPQPNTVYRIGITPALSEAVALFHLLDDRFDRGDVVTVAGEHFIIHRQPFARHHQRDADLFAIGPVIATVAALRERIALG